MCLKGVAIATLLVFAVHGFDFSAWKSKFSGGLNSGASSIFTSGSKSSDFSIPKLDESKAKFVHSSKSHKGKHHSSGSSSSSHKKVVISADGKQQTDESSASAGFNKNSKVDEAQESLYQKMADGSVVKKDAMKNTSSVDDSDYNMMKNHSLQTAKDGTMSEVNEEKVGNHSRSANIDENQQRSDVRGADGSHVVSNKGSRKSDEKIRSYDKESEMKKQKNKDGSVSTDQSEKLNNATLNRASDGSWDNYEQDDGKGNKKVAKISKEKSSESGTNEKQNKVTHKEANADGSSLAKTSVEVSKGTFDKGSEQENAYELEKNADGTFKSSAFSQGSNHSDVTGSVQNGTGVNIRDKDGNMNVVVKLDKNDFAKSSANQHRLNSRIIAGLNGAKSISQSGYDKSQNSGSNNSSSENMAVLTKTDGSVVSKNSTSNIGRSESSNKDNNFALQQSIDEKGNSKKHEVRNNYENKKTGEFVHASEDELQKNANGDIKKSSANKAVDRNTYEAAKSNSESKIEKNADGTFKEENRGTESRSKKTSGSMKSERKNYEKNGDVEKTSESLSAAADNSSDVQSRQYDNMHSLGKDGTEIKSDKESNQREQSANAEMRMEQKDSAKYANGTAVNSEMEASNKKHEGHRSSSDKNAQFVKKADGSQTKSEDLSQQNVEEQSETDESKTHSSVRHSDGTFDEQSSNKAASSAKRDATDARQSQFFNKDAKGNQQEQVKKSMTAESTVDLAARSDSSHQAKRADGSELNENASKNQNSSSMNAMDLSSDQSKLQMANGDTVINEKSSGVTHSKESSNLDSKHTKDAKGANGEIEKIDESVGEHSNLETRGQEASKKMYQKIGGKESFSDKGYSKSMKKGSSDTKIHKKHFADDKKGNIVDENSGLQKNIQVDSQDLTKHEKTVVM